MKQQSINEAVSKAINKHAKQTASFDCIADDEGRESIQHGY
jgi:hypothetical protein